MFEANLKNTTSFLFIRKHPFPRFQRYIALILLLCAGSASAQIVPDTGKPIPDILLFAEAAGFIPFNQSYRINYQTSLAGIPVEVAGGIGFPISSMLSGVFEIRYKRRTAVFVPEFRIKTLEIELAARDYLEKEHENDLRLYGSAGLLLTRSTAAGNINATPDGKNPVTAEVSQDYYNVGLGLSLGIEYPIAKYSGIYFGFHIGVYFADPTATGGLGNIGGVSIALGYRIGL